MATSGGASDATVATSLSGLLNVYTTTSTVAELLQITSFSASTNPTITDVKRIIQRKQDVIDARTRNSWQSGKRVTEEYYNYYHPLGLLREDYGSIPLRHRDLCTLTSGIDKIEVWNGSRYEDAVSEWTSGRNSDYWVDYKKGVIHFRSKRPYLNQDAMKATYRYGAAGVPKGIEELCTKMVAIDLIANEEYSMFLVEGSSSINLATRIELWKQDVEKLLDAFTELIVV